MNEEEFRKWWFDDNSLQDNGQKYANGTKEGYFNALKQLIINKEINLFDNDNIQELKSLLYRLEQGDLRKYNQRHRNTDTSNGLGNLIVGYNESRGSNDDSRGGSHNIIAGTYQNYTSSGGLVAGGYNTISASYATVTGGYGNTASGSYANVSGGQERVADDFSDWAAGGLYQDQ